MAVHRAMQKCAFILALIACHGILMSKGRPMKLAPRNTSVSAMHDKELQFIAPTCSNAGYMESAVPPAMHNRVSRFDQSALVNILDDFRPIDSGNGPEVGNSFVAVKKEEVTAEPLSAGGGDLQTVTGALSDFRPTGPGHSPGVGHVYRNKNNEPEA